MPRDHRNELKNIRTFSQLVRYLRDEMNWPIEQNSFEDDEDLYYDFTPEELGLDTNTSAKIEQIRRLKRLSANQPWGIFFVKFEPGRLPVIALRRILSQVVLKKRATAKASERTAWAADDILFVSNYGEGGERQICFAHFSQAVTKHDLPTLKVLGWDNLDTPLHLDDAAEKLTTNLAWPEDDKDIEAWRKSWRSAFVLRHREVVTTSHDLSIRLAELARAIRDRIKTALAHETERGPLTKLMMAFQASLVHDLDATGFADMYAQTIAYGLLSARIADPCKKTADDFASHMRTNPFLKELMQTFLHIGGRRGKAGGPGIDFDELGVSEVVELLDDANLEAVVMDFGDLKPEEDPVIHFYELFLKEYDKKQKVSRGVFYTPRPVVSYIVRSVDELLRTEFGLTDGLADTTTWGEMAERHKDLVIPEGFPPEQAFVQILDPATGTGTFLVEVIDLIQKTLIAKWETQGHRREKIEALWNEYVPKHLLPRLHGYELLMAPYAIAHLKIGLKLYETRYRFGSDERARIYLTNALEPASDIGQQTLSGMFPALAHEAKAVNEIKRKQRFTVVIGNPPYAGDSANPSRDGAGKLTFIGHLIEEYKKVDGQPLGERQPKWLQDDYVKFICFAEFLTATAGCGIVGFITNHSYLDNPTFRGMRQHLMTLFNHLWTLDLHGNTTKKETPPPGVEDVNVFDIKQGVAVMLGLRCEKACTQGAVEFAEIWGTREKKYSNLANETVAHTSWVRLAPSPSFYLFVRQNIDLRAEYEQALSITRVMPTFNVGFVTARDEFVVDFEPKPIRERIELFRKTEREMPTSEIQSRFGLKDTTSWNLKEAREMLRRDLTWDRSLTKCLYRAFDIRYISYSRVLLERPVYQIQRHLLPGDNLGLLVSRQVVDNFRHVFATNIIANFNTLATAGRLGAGPVFPLYLIAKDDANELKGFSPARVPNLAPDFLRHLSALLGLKQSTQYGLPTGLTPEDIFHYAYAVFYSPRYRSRYAEFLRGDFPHLPLTSNLNLFHDLSRFGSELVALHLMQSSKLDKHITEFVGSPNPEVKKVNYEGKAVWLDKDQTMGFKGIPEAVWSMKIGGYQVCERWLKDRNGRTLSPADLDHYQKIVVALNETIRLMTQIDEGIEKHGGWPGAFVMGKNVS